MFTEIITDYVDDKGVVHIDGYRTDSDDEQGVVIGYFMQGEVYWTNPIYKFDPLVKVIVEELKANYKKGLLETIDYLMLKEQKAIFMNMIQDWGEADDDGQRKDAATVEGILHLIDAIQDNAVANLGMDEKLVFNLN